MRKAQSQPNKTAKPSTLKKFMGIIVNIVFVLVMVLAISIVFFMVQEKLTGGKPQTDRFHLYVVMSGSMEPVLHTGSLVIVNPIAPELLAKNDMITFKGFDGSDKLITHRIVTVNQGDQISFTTRGDANDVNDPQPVSAKDVIGKVSFNIPYIGYLMNFAKTKIGLLVLIIIPGIFIIILEMRKLFQYAVQMDREKESKKQEAIKLEEHKKEWALNETVVVDVTATDQK